MDEVQNDMREASKRCVRLPQISFVIFFKGGKNLALKEREILEVETFNKVKVGIF
jgi:hypothetical protein